MQRWGVWRWWLLAPALVLVLSSWCQLHGSALGSRPVSLGLALPWAMEAALGWILAGVLMHGYGAQVLRKWGAGHPRILPLLMIATIVLVTLSSETLLIGEGPLPLWLYERFPLHALFATLWVAGFFWLRARRPAEVEALAAAATGASAERAELVDVMTGTGHARIRVADIECLESDRNYVNVHTPERSYLLRQTLSSLEKSLSPAEFLRVHRRTIVNRAKIRERRRGGVLVLSSGRVVRVSRAFAQRLQQRLN